jgi:hypothetical protein
MQIVQHPCAQESMDFRSREFFCNGTWCFAASVFSLMESWLWICKLSFFPCDLLAGIIVSPSTMLQLCSIGNHFWQNWLQVMYLHMRYASNRRYACIEGDSTFAPRREADLNFLGSRFYVQLLVLTRLEDRI